MNKLVQKNILKELGLTQKQETVVLSVLELREEDYVKLFEERSVKIEEEFSKAKELYKTKIESAERESIRKTIDGILKDLKIK